jgi:hypothetical protein
MPKSRTTLALITNKVSLAIHKYSSAQREIIKWWKSEKEINEIIGKPL